MTDPEDRRNLCRFEHIQPIDSSIVVDNPQMDPIVGQSSRRSSPPPSYSAIPGTVPLYMGRNAGPPPSYDDVINPEAPPPSYQSLFGQAREARKASNSFLDFIRKLILLIIGTIGCTLIIGFAVVIPLSMVIMGTVYMKECSVENIPEFLFVGGMVWIFKNLMSMWMQCHRSGIEDTTSIRFRRHESLLNCFLFGWFVAGCVIVYRAYEPDYYDHLSPNYCNHTVYMYAFWLVTSTFIVFAVFMTCLCGLTLSTVFTSTEDEIRDNFRE